MGEAQSLRHKILQRSTTCCRHRLKYLKLDRASLNPSTSSCFWAGTCRSFMLFLGEARTMGASLPNTWHPRTIEDTMQRQHFNTRYRLPQAATCVQQQLSTGKGRARLRRATKKKRRATSFPRNLAQSRQAAETETKPLTRGNDWKTHCVRLCIKQAEESVSQKWHFWTKLD